VKASKAIGCILRQLTEGFLRRVDDVQKTIVVLFALVNLAQQRIVAHQRAIVDDQVQRLGRLQVEAISIRHTTWYCVVRTI